MKDIKKKLGLDRKEIKDIAISTTLLAFIFAYDGFGTFLNPGPETFYKYLLYLTIIALAFIPHEMAHKFTAMHYGCIARYQIWWGGLKMAIFLAIITGGKFVIAAPGAVMIYTMKRDSWGNIHSRITKKQNAYISIAGPAANLIIAAAMLLFTGKAIVGGYDLAASIGYINSFLAMFNLLPIPPLDGSKIYPWNKAVWLGLLIAGFIMIGLF